MTVIEYNNKRLELQEQVSFYAQDAQDHMAQIALDNKEIARLKYQMQVLDAEYIKSSETAA